MTGEKVYDCYSYAKELGFTEAEARALAATKSGRGQDATVLRRIARGKGLIPADAAAKAGESIHVEGLKPISLTKKHRHSYRKDGACACGHVRRERKVKA